MNQIQITSLADSRLKERSRRCYSVEQSLKSTFHELDLIQYQLSELKRKQKQPSIFHEETDEHLETDCPIDIQQKKEDYLEHIIKGFANKKQNKTTPRMKLNEPETKKSSKSIYENKLSIKNLGINRYFQHFQVKAQQQGIKSKPMNRNSNALLMTKSQTTFKQKQVPQNHCRSQLFSNNLQQKQQQALKELEQMKLKFNKFINISILLRRFKKVMEKISMDRQISNQFQLYNLFFRVFTQIEKSIAKQPNSHRQKK